MHVEYEEIRNDFSAHYEKMLSIAKHSSIVANAEFEILPAMYIACDVAAVSADHDRESVAKIVYEEIIRLYPSLDETIFHNRCDLYGRIIRGEPLRCEWCFSDHSWYGKNAITKVAAVLGDILVNPFCADNYQSAPIVIKKNFQETMLFEIEVIKPLLDEFAALFDCIFTAEIHPESIVDAKIVPRISPDDIIIPEEQFEQKTDNESKALYNDGCSKMRRGAAQKKRGKYKKALSYYQMAFDIFQSISGWKDSDQKAERCKAIIDELSVLEEDIKKDRKKTKIAIILGIIMALSIITFFVLFYTLVPYKTYNYAIQQYNNGEYERAISQFESIRGYKNSEDWIESCKKRINENKYESAIQLFNSADYDNAIKAFESLSGYKNSEEWIDKCKKGINDDILKKAIELFKHGKTDASIEKLVSLGHVPVVDNAVASTCSTNGKTEGLHCSECKRVFVKQETVTKSPHMIVIDVAVPSTCTSEGKTQGSHCKICGEIMHAQMTIAPLQHTIVVEDAISATCTTPAKTEGSHCSVCGVVISEQKEIGEPLGHAFGTYSIIRDPTCTEEGIEERICSRCGDKESRSVAASGHRIVTDKPVDATCTTPAKTEGSHCSVCGVVISEQKEIGEPLGHNYKDGFCTRCGARRTSVGLSYLLKGDSYEVQGLGSCTDTEIVIPSVYNGKPVTSIAENAFSGCISITDVVIPNSVESIGQSAFLGCVGIESISLPFVGKSLNGYINKNFGYIFGTNFSYDNSKYVPATIKTVVVTNEKTISSGAFYGCAAIESITLPEGVTKIEQSAFQGCSSLKKVNIPDSVNIIELFAFEDCCSLESITFGENVITIGASAFSGCTSLESVTFGKKVTSIDDNAFKNCKSLRSAIIPNTVVFLGSSVFSGCSTMKNVTLSNSMTVLERSAFDGCVSLESITIPKNVSKIESFAFSDCSHLTSVTLHNGVKEIDSFAFNNCNKLAQVYYTGTISEWAKISIDSFNDALLKADIVYQASDD